MAIYQFPLYALPKKETIEYFGELPQKLGIEIQKRISENLKESFEDEFEYREAIQHKCWKLAKRNPEQITQRISEYLNIAHWGNSATSYNWKSEQELADNDAWISLSESEEHIEEFSFRCDLRQPKLKFLVEMIELADRQELVLMDIKGNIVLAIYDNILKLIKDSNAYRFITDPKQLIEDMEKGIIEIEGKRPKL